VLPSSVVGRLPALSEAEGSVVGIDAHMVGTQETGNETYIGQLATALVSWGATITLCTLPIRTQSPRCVRREVHFCA